MSNPVGRPPIFKTPEEMDKAINEYFDFCDNKTKEIHSDKLGDMIVPDPEPYTMSGLAYHLGMDRRTLVDYAEKTEFLPTIKRARERVEMDVERRMNGKDTFTAGLIFNAKNNFGWKDKSEVENTLIVPKPLLDNLDGVQDNNSSQEAQTTQEEN